MGWLSALGAVGAATVGAAKSWSHSATPQASWGDYMKADYFNSLAEQRALSNSKELFAYQQAAGPGLTMQGYRNAGLNPVLAGNFNGSVPGVPSSGGASPMRPSRVDKASYFLNMASMLTSLDEAQSRIEANKANAKSLVARTETEDALREYRQSLAYYKSINESQIPLKLKAFLKGQAIQNVVNAQRILLMNSQDRINAKQLDYMERNIKSLEDYRKRMADAAGKKDFIGWNNVVKVMFNTGDILRGVAHGAKQLFEGAPSVGTNPLSGDYLNGGYVPFYGGQ